MGVLSSLSIQLLALLALTGPSGRLVLLQLLLHPLIGKVVPTRAVFVFSVKHHALAAVLLSAHRASQEELRPYHTFTSFFEKGCTYLSPRPLLF